MNPRGTILVTGTDTEVGKTYVTCALAEILKTKGCDVVAIKPVESGCEGDATEDGVLLARATGQAEPVAALTRLSAPLAPPVAADIDGCALPFDAWCETIREQSAAHELVLVEGAGGLLSPLTWTKTALDLALECDAHVLIVAADRLGCQNHILLTREVLARASLPCLGVLLSAPERPDRSTGRNGDDLERFWGENTGPILTIPRNDPTSLTSVLPWLA